MDIWLSWDLLMDIRFGRDLLVDIWLSWDLLMDIRFGRDLDINIWLSWDLNMDIRLSSWVKVGISYRWVISSTINSTVDWGSSIGSWGSITSSIWNSGITISSIGNDLSFSHSGTESDNSDK